MMEVDARKHDTPEVLPWIPPGEYLLDTLTWILDVDNLFAFYNIFQRLDPSFINSRTIYRTNNQQICS